MILRGTLADRDPAAGIAVIGDGERGERAYRAGEALGGGVKLARVYPDHVVLLHEGVEETLTLTRDRNLAPGDIVRAPTAGDARIGEEHAGQHRRGECGRRVGGRERNRARAGRLAADDRSPAPESGRAGQARADRAGRRWRPADRRSRRCRHRT